MIIKVVSVDLERDRFWLSGGDADESAWMMRRLSRWPSAKIGDEFIITIQRAKDAPDWPEQKGEDNEC